MNLNLKALTQLLLDTKSTHDVSEVLYWAVDHKILLMDDIKRTPVFGGEFEVEILVGLFYRVTASEKVLHINMTKEMAEYMGLKGYTLIGPNLSYVRQVHTFPEIEKD